MASPLDQFKIIPLIPIEIGGIDISFTNSSLWMFFAAVVALGFLIISTERRKMVPDRAQAVSEKMYSLVTSMVRENIGEKGMEYFPLIFTTFLIVLMGNLLGLLPYSFTYTSHIFMTGALALFLFFTVIMLSIVKHGWHFLDLFNPPGVPLFLKPIVIPIELISYFSRPVTLSLRLFANLMAGHLMLKVFAGFCVSLGIIVGFLPALFNVMIYALELLVAILQAYVFTILTCIYFKDAVELEH